MPETFTCAALLRAAHPLTESHLERPRRYFWGPSLEFNPSGLPGRGEKLEDPRRRIPRPPVLVSPTPALVSLQRARGFVERPNRKSPPSPMGRRDGHQRLALWLFSLSPPGISRRSSSWGGGDAPGGLRRTNIFRFAGWAYGQRRDQGPFFPSFLPVGPFEHVEPRPSQAARANAIFDGP